MKDQYKTIVYKQSVNLKLTSAYEHSTEKLSKWKKFIADRLLSLLFKWKVFKEYYDEVPVGVFRDNPSKSKLISDAVLDHIYNVKKMSYDVTPETHVILMGEVTFRTLAKESLDNGQFKSNGALTYMSDPFYIMDPYQGRRVFQWPIHIVSYFDGILVVPKVIVEKRK